MVVLYINGIVVWYIFIQFAFSSIYKVAFKIETEKWIITMTVIKASSYLFLLLCSILIFPGKGLPARNFFPSVTHYDDGLKVCVPWYWKLVIVSELQQFQALAVTHNHYSDKIPAVQNCMICLLTSVRYIIGYKSVCMYEASSSYKQQSKGFQKYSSLIFSTENCNFFFSYDLIELLCMHQTKENKLLL